ncbi:MAG TPA: hypothetical protein VHC44_13390 [Verrucomicrobiae bacterium]|nr:hypothetical protein [Verrucomicrobiae bacterium]
MKPVRFKAAALFTVGGLFLAIALAHAGDEKTPPVTVKWNAAEPGSDMLSVSVTNHTDKPIVVDGKVWIVNVKEGSKYDLHDYVTPKSKELADYTAGMPPEFQDGVFSCFMEFVVPRAKWEKGDVWYSNVPMNQGGLPVMAHTVKPGETTVIQFRDPTGTYLGTKAIIGLSTTQEAITDFPVTLDHGKWVEKTAKQ